MSIDNSKKSPRLLQSRRYTHETFTDAQEAFTSVLDINANEVYVDQDLIPASSVPFGTSGDNLSIYSSGGQEVMKYYYRYKMTKSSTNNQVWFFTTGTTAGIDAQLIDSNQQKNFISPKYSIPSLSTANAEDSPVGYGVKVFVSTNSSSPSAGDQLDPTKFVFDYKTGVLQFVLTADAPDNTKYVYITAYQYVGRTLKDALVTSVASSSGTSGTSGADGVIGTSGSDGTSGTSGSNGTDGSSGSSGSNGTDGSSGTSGSNGSSGTSGSNGTDGSSGTSGSNGTDGSSGTSGISGVDGTDGSSGSNGTDGSSGTSGSSGSNGTDGTSGSSGTSGSNGTDGSSGSSGSNGTDGSSGTSGSNGTDGSSGTSGDSLFADSGSFWTTTNNVEITGSVKIKGVLTAEEYNVTLVSSSVLYSSGSTKFGDTHDDTHQFTGSVFVSGSINIVSGSLSIDGVSFSAMTSGTSGSNGTDGSSGTSGSNGTDGTSGSSGSNGTDGSSGSNGTDGSSGTSGSSGSNGTDGSSGSNGTDGSSGTSGSNGTDGSSGTSGSNGTDGTSGSNGTDGSSGTSGSNGTDGSSGSSGISGVDGTNGSSGSNGTDGSSGTSGSNGTNGSSGTSGDSLFAESGSFWATTNDIQITGSLSISSQLGINDANVLLNESASLVLTSGSNIYIENGGFITASFKGDGAGLYNIPATGVTGLQLDRIISGSVSASMADGTLRVNTDVNIDGTLTARELHINYVTSSVLYSSGSTKFGDTSDDLHEFTGSLRTSGSVVINGDLTVNGTTVLTSTDLLRESLIVSGAMAIMQAQIQAQLVSASLSMQGQRVITYDMGTGSVMDLGEF
jgi:hypothetical protein